jgi:hypothetical protein
MQSGDWNPNDARSWSRALGLVYVPMFPDALAKNEPGSHAVLMDGKASFALSICDDADQLKDRPVSWSWSSDVNHAIVVDSKREEFFVRRWDYPVARRFRLPENVGQAGKVVHILNQSGTLRAPDVVSHVLRAFRQVRAALHGQKTIEAVKVFLALLVAAERKKAGVLETSDINNARTVADVLSLLQNTGGTLDDIYQIEQRAKRAQIGTLLSDFSRPQPLTGCILEPGLLLRHAAGRLFQEANLVVERENFEQLHLAGLAPDAKSAGRLERDVRFTPPTLARTFACDKTGEFAVVQGHGWLWKHSPSSMELEGEEANRWFFRTELPFAYLAIFNSGVFERLLALFCPRVQGGQFDLSNRFVDKVPLPDLSQTDMVDGDVCASLVEMGRRIHAGRTIEELDQLENLVARIYRIPIGAVK